jgi:hypothetical protein
MGEGDPLAPFDEALFDVVGTDANVDAVRVRTLAVRHQRSMADLPGVENLLYEWRRNHGGAELGRTDEAYFAAAPATVWDEFATSLGATDAERQALVSLHERQVQRTLDVTAASDGTTYVVLERG